MGREIRRVPLDFDFPLGKTWNGFLTPKTLQGETCGDCHGKGTTPAYDWVMAIGLLLEDVTHDLGDQERGKPPHPYLAEVPHHPYDHGTYDPDQRAYTRPGVGLLRPSVDLLPLVAALTERAPERLTEVMAGYTYRIGNKLIEAAGFDPMQWGKCSTCKGEGELEKYEGQRAEREAWEPSDPPAGDGWQLWQTVSEGGPISPVFAAPEDLARWMASPEYTWGASKHERISYESALAFVNAGWAPSFASKPQTGPMSGVEYVGTQD